MTDDDILDDHFHGCGLTAYLEIWQETGQFPPDSELTRRRAYQLYEEALAEKNAADSPEEREREQAVKLEALRRDIQEGLDSGPATPLDLEEIKRLGRTRLSES